MLHLKKLPRCFPAAVAAAEIAVGAAAAVKPIINSKDGAGIVFTIFNLPRTTNRKQNRNCVNEHHQKMNSCFYH